jgi:hypothetical protein
MRQAMINSTIYLFVGLSFSILGVVFLVYTLILWVQERNQRGKGIRDAIASSLEFEQGLQPQSALSTVDSTPLTTSNPYERLSHVPSVSTVGVSNKSALESPIQAQATPVSSKLDHFYDHEQLVMALETLIQHRSLGIIDEDTYNKRKKDLLQHPDAPRRALNESTGSEIREDTTIDELLIDYMEGIISATEYERRKTQINSKTSSSSESHKNE